MSVRIINESPRGVQRKMPKYKAIEIAKDIIMDQLSTTYYKLEDEDYTDEEKELITQCINILGDKIGRSIGRNYYTL